ncbi:hypothetical protein HIM_00401 [Hirsutella minnesotensis 3608]|nr:hypothetical protein HIM_00401 [Hirsutella minnesotensis 3608]
MSRPNKPGATGPDGFMFQSITSSSALDNEIRFAAEKQLRTAFIVLASINAVFAVKTVTAIFIDCYVRARLKDPGYSLRASWPTIIGPRETFPYILSIGVFIQAIIFAVAQSHGLEAILTLGCTPISQMVLPALLIVPLINLMFGLEMTARALTSRPFPPSPRWALPLCLVGVLVGLITSVIVARVKVPPNFCFAELLWLVQRWSLGCFAVMTFIACVLLIGSSAIFYRLYRAVGLAEADRTAASWTASFMALGFFTTVVTLPFFWSLHADDTGDVQQYQTRLSMAATIVTNFSGVMIAALFLLLRFTRLGTFHPKDYLEFDMESPARGEQGWPNNILYSKQMEMPVSPVRLELRRELRRDGSEKGLIVASGKAKNERRPTFPNGLPQSPNAGKSGPRIVSPRAVTTQKVLPLTPKEPDTKSKLVLPAIAHKQGASPKAAKASAKNKTTDELLPPPAIWTGGHNRNSSVESSATVQIALRVSNINDIPPGTPQFHEPFTEAPVSPKGTYGIAITTDASPFADGAAASRASTPGPDDAFRLVEEALETQASTSSTAGKDDTGSGAGELRLSPSVYKPERKASKRSVESLSPRSSRPQAAPDQWV